MRNYTNLPLHAVAQESIQTLVDIFYDNIIRIIRNIVGGIVTRANYRDYYR